jgi:hypothetical protein
VELIVIDFGKLISSANHTIAYFEIKNRMSSLIRVFRVEEFRKPEFEVSSTYRPQKNHIASVKGDCV